MSENKGENLSSQACVITGLITGFKSGNRLQPLLGNGCCTSKAKLLNLFHPLAQDTLDHPL